MLIRANQFLETTHRQRQMKLWIIWHLLAWRVKSMSVPKECSYWNLPVLKQHLMHGLKNRKMVRRKRQRYPHQIQKKMLLMIQKIQMKMTSSANQNLLWMKTLLRKIQKNLQMKKLQKKAVRTNLKKQKKRQFLRRIQKKILQKKRRTNLIRRKMPKMYQNSQKVF